ncbi:MAG: hypothetical protein WED00_00735 [Aquisalimonadaceae bacterium]
MERSRQYRPEWDDSPIVMSLQDTVWSLLAAIAMAALAAGSPFWVHDLFVRDIYGPLIHGGPFIRVNYAYYALPAVLLAGILGSLMVIVVHIQRLRKVSRARVRPFVEWCVKGVYLGLILLLPVPMAAGWLTEQYVKQQGYEYCGKLFELGVATFSRGYVNDPRLCVSRFELESSLERYGYTDALRRYRFGKEP